jgi:predicted metal-dependent hydrolase
MKVRYPNFDFATAKAHWAPCIEFAQRANASSIIPSYVEPYLVKVMLKARPHIRPSETALDQDVVVFCKQEAQHNKQHNNQHNLMSCKIQSRWLVTYLKKELLLQKLLVLHLQPLTHGKQSTWLCHLHHHHCHIFLLLFL